MIDHHSGEDLEFLSLFVKSVIERKSFWRSVLHIYRTLKKVKWETDYIVAPQKQLGFSMLRLLYKCWLSLTKTYSISLERLIFQYLLTWLNLLYCKVVWILHFWNLIQFDNLMKPNLNCFTVLMFWGNMSDWKFLI